MKIALIICTYMRPKAIISLLDSIKIQSKYPDEIIVVDGSLNNETKECLLDKDYKKLKYYQVEDANRGLTRQRNYGISKVSSNIDVVAFLDDDTLLKANYFEELLKTFTIPKIVGVGGVAINENRWFQADPNQKYNAKHFYRIENYVIKESLRNVIRNYLGLNSNLFPAQMPEFSNGKTYGYPLNGKIYEVDLLVGMSFAFRKKIVDSISFSTYFEGYGLYEDADFSIRAQSLGINVINTKVQLSHHHDPLGRPNMYKYGKMVIRNGWYVWRLKYPSPSLKARFKWNAIALLLMTLRFFNVFTTKNRKEAFMEFLGRKVGLLSLIISKPKIQR